jgi:hypothetical protein
MKKDEWKIKINDFNQSGLTVKQWSTNNGLSSKTVSRWKNYFKEPIQSYKFQEIKNTKKPNIKIKCGNLIFEIDSDFNEVVLKRFIKVLKSC